MTQYEAPSPRRNSGSTHSGRRRAGQGLCAVLAVLGAAAAARQLPPGAPADGGAPRVIVLFRAQATAVNGPTGVPRASVARDAPAGGQATAKFAASASQPNLCSVTSLDPGDVTDAFVTWDLSATVVDVQGANVQLAVQWVRTGLAPIGGAESAAGAPAIRLRPGQTHVLDGVFGPPVVSRGCANVVVSVEVAVADPGTETLLGYHLTLVHERAGDSSSAPALDLVGRPGESLEFRFRPLRWPVGQGAGPDGPPAVGMDVLGTVSGVLTSNGRVDVSLAAVRRLVFGGAHQGSGAVHFLAGVGEEIAVEIPRAATTAWRPWPEAGRLSSLADGVTVEGGGLRAEYASFFANDRTSLVIRVDRVR